MDKFYAKAIMFLVNAILIMVTTAITSYNYIRTIIECARNIIIAYA